MWIEEINAALILLDLSATFDMVNHFSLVSLLESISINGTALKLIRFFLSSREQVVALEDFTSAPFSLPCGLSGIFIKSVFA